MVLCAKKIDVLLPQTQCGECGFSGCLPYAKAIVAGESIDKCPPGGVSTLEALAALLQKDAKPFIEKVAANTRKPSVALIREADCIGCTKCIQVCPVDAIVGAGKLMHVVLTKDCTGCGLCVEPCPVDCIEMVEIEEPVYDRNRARQRHEARLQRDLLQAQKAVASYVDNKKASGLNDGQKKFRQDYILQALLRKKAQSKEGV